MTVEYQTNVNGEVKTGTLDLSESRLCEAMIMLMCDYESEISTAFINGWRYVKFKKKSNGKFFTLKIRKEQTL